MSCLSNDAVNNIDGIRIAEIKTTHSDSDNLQLHNHFFYVSAKTTSPLNAKFTAYRGGPVERNFL